MFELKEHSHRRLNILTGEWIMVSPHRTKRPWQGKLEQVSKGGRPVYEPGCYLCPGNPRADGSRNPVYEQPYAFTNDFASLLPKVPEGRINQQNLLIAESVSGTCRVISFSPDHSLTLPLMPLPQIRAVVDLWCEEFRSIAADPSIRYIQIFENKGEIMGCSNPHPHGQIWAQNTLPVELMKETEQQRRYYVGHGRSLLGDYLELELQEAERIVWKNESFVALVPFWATWPFETLLISRQPLQHITDLSEKQKNDFASILKALTVKYDNLFETSFPYSAGIHQAPVNSGDHPEWHLHMHFYPPLLRSATVKKFMVGYEMLANPQRDITPEWAAAQLRAQSLQHYSLNHPIHEAGVN